MVIEDGGLKHSSGGEDGEKSMNLRNILMVCRTCWICYGA